MTDLYTVLDVDPDGTPDGQHVEVSTSFDDAKRRRDELQAMAVDDREAADFRVFQLVEPGAAPTPVVLDYDRVGVAFADELERRGYFSKLSVEEAVEFNRKVMARFVEQSAPVAGIREALAEAAEVEPDDLGEARDTT